MTETPIYFLCPIHFPPILYIPLISLSQQHLMLGFTYQQEQRMTFSKLLKFNTAHIVSFVNWSWPSEALNHCFLFGQLLSLVFSENLQPFMLSSHWIFPMVSWHKQLDVMHFSRERKMISELGNQKTMISIPTIYYLCNLKQISWQS